MRIYSWCGKIIRLWGRVDATPPSPTIRIGTSFGGCQHKACTYPRSSLARWPSCRHPEWPGHTTRIQYLLRMGWLCQKRVQGSHGCVLHLHIPVYYPWARPYGICLWVMGRTGIVTCHSHSHPRSSRQSVHILYAPNSPGEPSPPLCIHQQYRDSDTHSVAGLQDGDVQSRSMNCCSFVKVICE